LSAYRGKGHKKKDRKANLRNHKRERRKGEKKNIRNTSSKSTIKRARTPQGRVLREKKKKTGQQMQGPGINKGR